MQAISEKETYLDFVKKKVIISEDFGFEINRDELTPDLKPHTKDIVDWALRGGRRAVFASFGLHKTITQLEIAKFVIQKTGKPFLICCPLAVFLEFRKDAIKFNIPYPLHYITDTDNIEYFAPQIYVTNYERVRMGDIDPSKFGGVSFDEASILRNLKTETTNYVLKHFKAVPYRFVATATPTPNDYIEILNYAVFLGVASRGHLLTRFFKRNPVKAGDLKLNPNKKKEFWQWVATWAVFINLPSDLGYSDEGYILPPLNIVEHEVPGISRESYINDRGELVMFKQRTKGLKSVSKEKRESIGSRCDAAFALAKELPSAILWHHLEAEREYLEVLFKGMNAHSVYGAQKKGLKEKFLSGFAEGEFNYLLTKPKIAGSGCNFQGHCYNHVFVGIDYKFNDFIQAVHRLLRFGQEHQVALHLFFTKEEYEVLKTLYRKWEQHDELVKEMTDIVKEFGLNKNFIQQQMERQLFTDEKKVIIGDCELHNNDTVLVHQAMADNSVHMILTSIPFGDHYEYSENYNDFGHNHGNKEFFKQMDFLTPHLLRVLKPGRIAAIHVKDRIRYSYQNGTKFTTVDDFMGDTIAHFEKKHVLQQINRVKDVLKYKRFDIPEELPYLKGFKKRIVEKQYKHLLAELKADYSNRFYLTGKITVTTDVVAENNQTNRLTWKEQRKDATRNGVGSPEYILLFRKAPTQTKNSYADEPVTKTKAEYDLATHQVNASSYHRSDGNRLLTSEEILKYDLSYLQKLWKERLTEGYNYEAHIQACRELEQAGKLSRLYTTLPLHSNTDTVWSDINRMNTLNCKQVSSKKETHICPLQLDIIRRLIDWFTMPGELVDDPFGGLFSTPYVAMEMNRKSVSAELNSDYFKDGCFYVKAMHYQLSAPTLFDVLPFNQAS